MNLIKSSLTALLLLCSYVAFSQATISGELRKWHTVSITFNGPATSENDTKNPFLEYRLNVTFTSPSGKTFIVPGFYAADGNAAETGANSGNKWVVRFTPNETGQWNYNASFRTGSNIAINPDPNAGTPSSFNGATGNFSILGTNKSAPDNRAKGRLNYVGERYLKFEETGEYFLKAGSDSPENLLAYGDFDNTTNSKTWSPHLQDWNQGDPVWHGGKGKGLIGAINYLAGKGLNAFSFLPMNVIGDGKDVWPWAATSHSALDGTTGPDVQNRARYDVSKLEQWEILFSHADRKGMYLHFKTQETENDRLLDGGQLGTNRKLYYRELIARFGHHLALNWNLGEENTNTPAHREEFAQWFYDNDPYRHNVVIHTYPSQSDGVYSALIDNKSKYTGASIQEDIETVHSEVLQWIQRSKAAGKPWIVANDEQGHWRTGVAADANYAGDKGIQGDNRYETRHKILWGTLMAGGAGVEYYFGYETGETDLSAHDWRSRDSKWNDARTALDFFEEHLPYWEMHSNDGLTSITNDYCFAKQGEIYAIYLPTGGSTNLNLSSASGTYTVRWYNPKNGGNLTIGSVSEVNGGGNVSIGNPPNNSSTDWVALINRNKGSSSGSGSTNNGCDADFEEQNGLVVIEAENLVVPIGWSNKSTTEGFSGNGYLEWEGGDNFNLPGTGVISTKIKINQTGTYIFKWRNKVGHGTNPTESNDSWLRFPDADDFFGGKDNGSVVYPHGSGKTPTPHGAGSSGWFKVNSSGGIVWNWTTWTNDGDGHHIYVTFNTPGVYTMEISGRSNYHLIDRIVLSKDIANPTNLALTETPCQEQENTTVSVTDIAVSPEETTMVEGDVVNLSFEIFPANATNKTVVWTSSDAGVAIVDQNGTVTAINEGSVTITAKTEDGNFTDTSMIQVSPLTDPENPTVGVSGIVVSPKDVAMVEGNVLQLTATVLPADATNKEVIWSSSDTGIATVDQDGMVTAVKEGTVTIIVRTDQGSFTDTSEIQVSSVTEPENTVIPVTGISITPKEADMEEGNILQLGFQVSPVNATNTTVLWSSSDTQIVIVDQNGIITAKKEGSVVITARTEDGNFTDTSTIQVLPKTELEPVTSCDSDYVEENNLVIIEAENLEVPTGWSNKSVVSGFTGSGYLEWAGGDNFNTPGSGLVSSKIKIKEAGTYLFQWRTKVGEGTNPTESNDTWLRFPDADDFYGGKYDGSSIVYPKGSGKTPLTIGSGSDGWFKVNSSAPVANWTWTTYTNDGDGHNIYVTFDAPGIYTMEISGRSNHHLIDRIVLSKDVGNPTELSLQETPCTGADKNMGPRLEIENSSAIEGHNIEFSINLSYESTETIILEMEFLNETASAEDYFPNVKTVTFAPGETSKILSIPTRNDNTMEEDETFKVGIAEVTSGTVADFSDIAIGTIIDEDAPLNVYPNPAMANSNIQLDGMQPGLYEIALFSISGELIQKEMITVEGTHEFFLKNMTKGLYIIRAANIERSYTGKLVIQQ